MAIVIAEGFEGLPRSERSMGIVAALRSAFVPAPRGGDGVAGRPTKPRPAWVHQVRATEDSLDDEEREVVLSLADAAVRAA
jgi:hypothetical protein